MEQSLPWTLVHTEYNGISVEAINNYGGAPYPDQYRVTFHDDDVGYFVKEFTPREYGRMLQIMQAAVFAPPA
jgi:hypothetical protein